MPVSSLLTNKILAKAGIGHEVKKQENHYRITKKTHTPITKKTDDQLNNRQQYVKLNNQV